MGNYPRAGATAGIDAAAPGGTRRVGRDLRRAARPAPGLQSKRHVAHHRARQPHAADVALAISLTVDEQLALGGESD